MNRLVTLLVFTWFLSWIPWSHAATEEAVLSVSLQVEGMTCIGCEARVQKALEVIPGVRSARVSYQKSEVAVAYDKDQVAVDQIIQAVNNAGFKASLKTHKQSTRQEDHHRGGKNGRQTMEHRDCRHDLRALCSYGGERLALGPRCP